MTLDIGLLSHYIKAIFKAWKRVYEDHKYVKSSKDGKWHGIWRSETHFKLYPLRRP